jgi:hypothetical protein
MATYELVLDQDFHHGLNAQLSVFRNDANHLIAATEDNQTNTVFENLSSVRTWGVEAELTKKFANAVRGFVNGTWQQSRENASTPINSPEWIGNLGVVVPVVGDKLAVALRENYVSSRATRVPGLQTQDKVVTDLTISSENALPNWSFLLSVQNLFDDRSGVPAGPDGTLDTIPQHGRTVYFRATYKFRREDDISPTYGKAAVAQRVDVLRGACFVHAVSGRDDSRAEEPRLAAVQRGGQRLHPGMDGARHGCLHSDALAGRLGQRRWPCAGGDKRATARDRRRGNGCHALGNHKRNRACRILHGGQRPAERYG